MNTLKRIGTAWQIACILMLMVMSNGWASNFSNVNVVPGSLIVKTSAGTEKAAITNTGALRLNTNKFTVDANGAGSFASNLTVGGNLAVTGTWSLNSGIAVDTDHFVVNGTTGLVTIKPTTTTTQALLVNGNDITTGDVLQLRGTSTMGTDGYYLRILEDATEVLSVKRTGLNGVLAKVTGTFETTGASTLASLACTAAGTFGGGYGSTGATISTAGVGQFNGALTTDGALTADSAVVGGGYGSTGATISTAGVIQANGAITTDAALTADNVVCTNAATIGGGYASTGATISTAGVGQFAGALTTDGALTADNIVCTNAATFGGGYASTGATISTAGVGQFAGAITTDGALTAASVSTTGAIAGRNTWNAAISAGTATLTVAGTPSGSVIPVTAATCAITLPAVASSAGVYYKIIMKGATSLTITGATACVLADATTVKTNVVYTTTVLNSWYFLECDGTNWYVHAKAAPDSSS
ncbi:MAG: autotransporter outer membrane beta-barrel domain-containing protein [Armatimonadota bacterium]